MAANQAQNLPPPQSPFVDDKLTLSYDGYQFLLFLLNTALNAVPTATLDANVNAAGATQATATQLGSQWNVVSGGAGGVLLQGLADGQTQTVINATANPINVFPPAGVQINSLGNNVAYSLNAGFEQVFRFISSAQILTAKLQIP